MMMPEATADAMILISTSFQALGRAGKRYEKTMICDCSVVIVFACFFVEANLSHLIKCMGKTEEVNKLYGDHPGLKNKLAWFYYRFIEKENIQKKINDSKLEKEFPGFFDLREFRNHLAHGVIDTTLANFEKAEELRLAAKEIVDKLYSIASTEGIDVPRNITYEVAITGSEKPAKDGKPPSINASS
jgi:hypothetical protein